MKRENFKLKRENENQCKSLMYYEKEFKVVERVKKQFKDITRTIKKQEEVINTQNEVISELRDNNNHLKNQLNKKVDQSRIRKKYTITPKISPNASPVRSRSERASTERLKSKKHDHPLNFSNKFLLNDNKDGKLGVNQGETNGLTNQKKFINQKQLIKKGESNYEQYNKDFKNITESKVKESKDNSKSKKKIDPQISELKDE